MAVVNRKEFALMCNIDVKKLNVYVSRKKVVTVAGDRSLVDTANVINKTFIDKWRSKSTDTPPLAAPMIRKTREVVQEKKEVKEVVKKNPKVVVKKKPVLKKEKVIAQVTPKESAEQKRDRLKQNEESEKIHSLDLRKKKAEVLKIEREAEIKLLDIIKKNGEAIPTDFVVRMVTVLIREMLANFDSSTIRIAGKFCDIVGADRKMLVRVNTDLNYEMQKIIKEAEKDAKYQIKNAIKEYSITRGKGERNN